MTVLKRETEPKGTYTDGYDAGLQDATERRPRAYRRPSGRERNAGAFRFGYADGYDDGGTGEPPTDIAKAAVPTPEPHEESAP